VFRGKKKSGLVSQQGRYKAGKIIGEIQEGAREGGILQIFSCEREGEKKEKYEGRLPGIGGSNAAGCTLQIQGSLTE